MSQSTYSSIGMIIGVALLIAICVGLYSLVLMVIRWKTPERRRHLVRLVYAAIAVPCLAGIQYAILFFVFLPSLGSQKMTKIDAAHATQFAETTLVKVGDTIPEMSFETIDGDTVSLPSPGQVVLINFFATWCGPCQMELPHIEKIWSDLRNADHFKLVVVGREETVETVRAYRQEHGFSFPMAADPQREIYSLFANESIPRTLVVSPAGQVVYSKTGFSETDIEELKAVLKEQLASFK